MDTEPITLRLDELPLWRLLVALADAERVAGSNSPTARVLAREINRRLAGPLPGDTGSAAPVPRRGCAVADVLPLRIPVAEPPTDPVGPPLVVEARRLAVMLCAGIRTVRTWDAAGKLPKPVRIGGRVVWRVDEIRAWLAAGAPDRATWAAIRDARK